VSRHFRHDLFEAMKEIQGYLDITPSDLKEVYRHAFRHARSASAGRSPRRRS